MSHRVHIILIMMNSWQNISIWIGNVFFLYSLPTVAPITTRKIWRAMPLLLALHLIESKVFAYMLDTHFKQAVQCNGWEHRIKK